MELLWANTQQPLQRCQTTNSTLCRVLIVQLRRVQRVSWLAGTENRRSHCIARRTGCWSEIRLHSFVSPFFTNNGNYLALTCYLHRWCQRPAALTPRTSNLSIWNPFWNAGLGALLRRARLRWSSIILFRRPLGPWLPLVAVFVYSRPVIAKRECNLICDHKKTKVIKVKTKIGGYVVSTIYFFPCF